MTDFLVYSMIATLLAGGLIIFVALGTRTALQQDPGSLAARVTLWISGIYTVVVVLAFGAYAADVLLDRIVDVPILVNAYFPIDSLDSQPSGDHRFVSEGNALLTLAMTGLPTLFVALRLISTALGATVVLALSLSIFALARKHLGGAPLLATAGTIAWRGTVITFLAASVKAAIDWFSLGWFATRFDEHLVQYELAHEGSASNVQIVTEFSLRQIELWPFIVALMFCVFALILTANARLEKETAGLV